MGSLSLSLVDQIRQLDSVRHDGFSPQPNSACCVGVGLFTRPVYFREQLLRIDLATRRILKQTNKQKPVEVCRREKLVSLRTWFSVSIASSCDPKSSSARAAAVTADAAATPSRLLPLDTSSRARSMIALDKPTRSANSRAAERPASR